ncbi:hypothetical protein CYLTODRAFT_416714 [Cylindrobasidium torrendii FP15055 ss-10]|uniref:Ubiquitin-like-conjugating enzyme ATG10 n=1 Tax=Cylindrobasidium torrendii FP15055 ss-10 TaxID=1314674 RepID=A0A0D7BU54_9AGAR|nr:hypothetical protein CYLTODRAFT_416714 [Cylindrobasidium torrendii FP15055 ss-10]
MNLETVEDVTAEDEATAPIPPHACTSLTWRQYVAYSDTFHVPVFYFSVHDANGSPLSLLELIQTSIFRAELQTGTQKTDFGLSRAGSTFPLLSQGDHPTLGIPCWYLHPCETGRAVAELLGEDDSSALRWLEMWFVVLGTAIYT